MSYHQRISSPMSPLYKRLHANTEIFSIQIGGNRLPAMRSIKTNLHFQSHKLWPLRSRSTKIWSQSTSRAATLEMVVLEEGHMSSQMWIFTSVARRAIPRKTTGQRELCLVVTYPRSLQTILQNGWLRSLLFQIPNIFQHPPWHATIRSTSDVPLSIMVIVHGDFTVRMSTMSGETSKAINHMLVFPIPLPLK